MLAINSCVDEKYRIIRLVSRDEAGALFLASKETNDEPVWVREVHKSGPESGMPVSRSLAAESLDLKALRHPNLSPVVDVVETKQTYQIVLDYVEGTPLDCVLKGSGLPPRQKMTLWINQLCAVFHYLHSCSPTVVQGEIEPGGVLIKPDGDLVLLGYGLIKKIDGNRLADTATDKCAPEQYDPVGWVDARTDIYALGRLLFTFADQSWAGLERIAQKCTHPDPRERYQSCDELMQALAHCDGADVAVKPDQEGAPVPEHLKPDVVVVDRRIPKGENQEKAGGKTRNPRKPFNRNVVFWVLISLAAVVLAISVGSLFFWDLAPKSYTQLLSEAAEEKRTHEERADLYMKAILMKPADSKAYAEMLAFFLSDDERPGVLTKRDAERLEQLKSGVEMRDSKFRPPVTVYPLREFQSENSSGYRSVSLQIGLAYWYRYDHYLADQSQRRSLAVAWLKEAADSHKVAQALVDINGSYLALGKDPLLKSDAEKAYRTLSESLNRLRIDAGSSSIDRDTCVMIWDEYVSAVIKYVDPFFEFDAVDFFSMMSGLERLEDSLMRFQGDDVQAVLDKVQIALVLVEGHKGPNILFIPREKR
ncbi:MAG: protein kinase [Peptococcaceae bacterium]|nr:protein kinase [Peptococcaceae bacterium]